MEAMQDQNSCQQFEEVYHLNRSAEDWLFDQIASQLQEIVIDQQFERSLTNYMQQHWHVFDKGCSQAQLQTVFQEYQVQMKTFLQTNIRRKVPEFQWKSFQELLKNRKHLIDEQILDTLQSLESRDHFLNFIRDYRNAHEEEQRLKVLTIKNNKISAEKVVKGRNNIFAQGENQNLTIFSKDLRGTQGQKRDCGEKKEWELLVPELILTVKPMRKC